MRTVSGREVDEITSQFSKPISMIKVITLLWKESTSAEVEVGRIGESVALDIVLK